MDGHDPSTLPAQRTRRFFEAHISAHPEEASTLGIREHDARLADPSPVAALAELAQLRETLRDANALLATTALDPSERLDLDAVVRVASFHARRIEQDTDASNLELAVLPNSALQHAALHSRSADHWEAVAARAHAVPAFLAAHAENLRRGVREGRAPDRDVARTFIDRILPGSAESIATLGAAAVARGAPTDVAARVDEGARAASEAYRSLQRFVEEVVLPAARADVRLGEDEVAFRLREAMGLSRTAAELLAFAKAELARARAAIEQEAAAMGGSDPRALVQEVCARRPATVDDALALYRTNLEAATRLVVERDLVPVPELALDLAPLPAGIADGGPVTNWPAPLLDPEGRGHVLYAPEIGAHASIATKNLAVHEGIPGHYLQSVAWQRMRVDRVRAVRWIGVADHVAMSRAYFGTMLSVEGWAVHMEQLLREHGFYEPGAETLFFAVCDAIRASRVVLDLELHAGNMDTTAAERFVAEATLMSEGWARWSVLRAKRIPLQGITYLVGAQEIRGLRERRPSGESLSSFHARILEAGPVPLARLV